MAAQSFIKASDAAAIGGVTVAQLGCTSGNQYPKKGGFVASGGTFDLERLASYDTDDFVLENDVAVGTFYVQLAMGTGVAIRGNVQLDDGSQASEVLVLCNQGQNVVAKCILPDASDLFLGWYNEDDELVSTDQQYAFTVNEAVSLIAKVAYMSLSVNSLAFGYAQSSKQFTINSNVQWEIT